MSSKLTSLFIITLIFFFFAVTNAGRPEPAFPKDSPMKPQQGDVEVEKVEVDDQSSCEGVGEEECLMRRTLTAHLDYIYTQKHKP